MNMIIQSFTRLYMHCAEVRHNSIIPRGLDLKETKGEVSDSREELPEAVFMHDGFEFARLTNE